MSITGDVGRIKRVGLDQTARQLAVIGINDQVRLWDLKSKKGIGSTFPEWMKGSAPEWRSANGQFFAIPASDGSVFLIHSSGSVRQDGTKPVIDW
jgi:hypothetical protein